MIIINKKTTKKMEKEKEGTSSASPWQSSERSQHTSSDERSTKPPKISKWDPAFGVITYTTKDHKHIKMVLPMAMAVGTARDIAREQLAAIEYTQINDDTNADTLLKDIPKR